MTARVMCGRRPIDKSFLTLVQLVGCGHVSGLFVRHGWPLALMLSANQVPIQLAHSNDALTLTGSPGSRTTVSALRRHALANSFSCPLSNLCRSRHYLRFLEPLAAHHHRPGHASDLVGERNGSHFGRPASD